MLGLDLPVSFLLILRFFQRLELLFGENDAVLGNLRLKGLETLLEGLQIVSLPDAPDPAGRNKHALALHFVGDAELSPGGLLESQTTDCILPFGGDSVLPTGPMDRSWPGRPPYVCGAI